MSSAQVEALLSELCIELGFCLPPNEQARLRESPPTEVDVFTDGVIRAEGLDPYADIPLELRRDVQARVARHFRKAEDEQQFRSMIETTRPNPTTIPVQIVRFTDAAQPGWVECSLRDARGREWILVDKVPIFTSALLDADSNYPQPGVVWCEILREWTDEQGRRRALITTERPDGVEAKGGETQFEVFSDQITRHVA